MRTLMLLALLVSACGSTSPVILPSPQERADAIALLKQLQDAGGITRYSCENHEALVAPATWLRADADRKRSLTIAFGAACDGVPITVIDSQSGKRLAHVGPQGYAVD